MNKYAEGKIYKLTNDKTDKIYIGSTVQKLYRRLAKHKMENNECSSKEIMLLGGSKIELIEQYPCNSKIELLEREQYYINLNKNICVNAVNARRDINYIKIYNDTHKEEHKQYRENNKEKISKYQKEHYEKNREKIREYGKKWAAERILCECGSTISRGKVNAHIKTAKHKSLIS